MKQVRKKEFKIVALDPDHKIFIVNKTFFANFH